MNSPFLIALSASALGLLIAFLLVIGQWVGSQEAAGGRPPAQGTPWQITLPAPGHAEVLGLKLPGTTLDEVQQRWGQDLKLALMAGSDGSLALEGYLQTFEASGVTGRLMLLFDTQTQVGSMQRWRDSLPGLPTSSGGRQHALSDAAMVDLARTGLVGISFIPVAQLDADVLTARFGQPAERLVGGGRLEHWLYPTLGLAVVLDSDGREVLQYVAPADFERLLAAPLRVGKAPQ